MTELTATAPIAAAPIVEAAIAPVATAVATKFTPGAASVGGAPVMAIKPEGATSVIRMYESGTHGFIVIQQVTLDMSNPVWPRQRKRSTLIKGTKEILTLVATHLIDKKTLELKGKLIVEEVLYDEAFRAEVENARTKYAETPRGPLSRFVEQLNLKAEDEDAMLKDVLKRAGRNDAPVLTVNIEGEDTPILKFTRYQEKVNPATGQYDADISIQHDNYEEIAQYRADNPQDKTE